jgi:hypothetical protein
MAASRAMPASAACSARCSSIRGDDHFAKPACHVGKAYRHRNSSVGSIMASADVPHLTAPFATPNICRRQDAWRSSRPPMIYTLGKPEDPFIVRPEFGTIEGIHGPSPKVLW